MDNNYCVIMAGGIGSRFWPFSRNNRPKQFLDFLGTGRSLLQMTFDRFKQIVPTENILIVSNVIYKNLILNQLPGITENQILLEPARRNTAPCIAYAIHRIKAMTDKANIVVTPSDHLILNNDIFAQNIRTGIDFISKHNALLTLGIKPTRPETSYGYIQIEDGNTALRKVKTFTEKPNAELAQMFYDSDEFLWNTGIFIWKTQDIIQEFKNHMYDLHALFTTDSKLNTPEESSFVRNVYGQCHNISIDVGIMEKSQHVYVLKGNFGWSDVGTWHTFHDLCEKDGNNNVSNSPKVILNESHNCIVNVPQRKNVVIQGVDDIIVAEKDNYLMICHRKDENQIKRFEKYFRRKQ